MKLFLTSSFSSIPTQAKQHLGDLSWKQVAYITNAADEYIAKKWPDLWRIKRDKDLLVEMWCELIPVDLRIIQGNELQVILDHCDGMFVWGGNVSYLRWVMQTSGLDTMMKEFLEKDSAFYIGSSAGSCVMGNWIEYLDDGEKCYDIYDGLGYVDAIILPHWWTEDFVAWSLERVAKMINIGKNLLTITDRQAIVVNDGGMRIVEEL